jgi:hypothetical protein
MRHGTQHNYLAKMYFYSFAQNTTRPKLTIPNASQLYSAPRNRLAINILTSIAPCSTLLHKTQHSCTSHNCINQQDDISILQLQTTLDLTGANHTPGRSAIMSRLARKYFYFPAPHWTLPNWTKHDVTEQSNTP